MTVYIDGMGFIGRNGALYYHMYADTLSELHNFAAKIGLKKSWFEISNKGLEHYDVSGAQYVNAVFHGAIECDRYGALYHLAKLNWDGKMIDRIMKWRRQTFGFEYEHSPHDHRWKPAPRRPERREIYGSAYGRNPRNGAGLWGTGDQDAQTSDEGW